MFFRFLPKETNFFDLFEAQVGCAVDAATCFKEIVAKGAVAPDLLKRMQAIEHQGDDAAHSIFDQLNKTFITPFDREDIHTLTKQLDDVIDMLNTIVNRLSVYKINSVNMNLVAFAAVIEESVHAMACAVNGLNNPKTYRNVFEYCVEVNRLENVGDSMRDAMISSLFETEKDPVAVIKWKELYEDAETVLDICEDVVHVVESILVKQA